MHQNSILLSIFIANIRQYIHSEYIYIYIICQLPESLADKLRQYISDQEELKSKKKKGKKKKKSVKPKKKDESQHEIGNLEDILDENDLNEFEQSAQKYRSDKAKSGQLNKPKSTNKSCKTKNKEPQQIDLLGFSDIFNGSTNNNDNINND